MFYALQIIICRCELSLVFERLTFMATFTSCSESFCTHCKDQDVGTISHTFYDTSFSAELPYPFFCYSAETALLSQRLVKRQITCRVGLSKWLFKWQSHFLDHPDTQKELMVAFYDSAGH